MSQLKNEITDYLLENFKNVREYTDENNVTWYAAIDITKQMGYSNNFKAIKDHCCEKGIIKVICIEDGKRHPTLFINEENICRLVLAAKISSADRLKDNIYKFIYS